MATLAMVKWYVEGNDLAKEMQQDVQAIEGDPANIVGAWDDLTFDIQNNPEFKDILNSPYSSSKTLLAKVTNDAETYMQSVSIQVQAPNDDGHGDYINLYVGTPYLTIDQDEGSEFYGEYVIRYAAGSDLNHAATLWDMISHPNLNLTTSYIDCYYNCLAPGGIGQQLGANWSMDPNSQINFSANQDADDQGDGGKYCAAQGSFAQWAPYVHLTGGDPGAISALNHDVFLQA